MKGSESEFSALPAVFGETLLETCSGDGDGDGDGDGLGLGASAAGVGVALAHLFARLDCAGDTCAVNRSNIKTVTQVSVLLNVITVLGR